MLEQVSDPHPVATRLRRPEIAHEHREQRGVAGKGGRRAGGCNERRVERRQAVAERDELLGGAHPVADPVSLAAGANRLEVVGQRVGEGATSLCAPLCDEATRLSR